MYVCGTYVPIGYSVIVNLPLEYSVINRFPYRAQCNNSSKNRSSYRIQFNSSSNGSPYRIQCNSNSNRSPYRMQLQYSLMVGFVY